MDSNPYTNYRFPLFEPEKWHSYLKEHGFVIVSNVISPETCQQTVTQIKEVLTKFSPKLDLNDPKTWSVDDNYPYALHGGMINYVGHTSFQWKLRELIAPVFASIWNCKETDLATSFDGFCYMDGTRKYSERPDLSFARSDQSPMREGLWSYQGVLNLCDNEQNDGGLIVIPETHKSCGDFFKKIGKDDHKSDWYQFSEEEKQDDIFKNYIKLCAKAGDFMMFDSRTFHCNTVPCSDNVRACLYICQVPKSQLNESARKDRMEAFLERRCTSHHPVDFRVFPVVPKKADESLKETIPHVSLKLEDLNDLQRSLLCGE